MVYSTKNYLDVYDFLKIIDEFKKDKNKKKPLIRGYVVRDEKNKYIFFLVSRKNDNHRIQINMKEFTQDIIKKDIIVKSDFYKNYYGKYNYNQLEIIDWLFIENIIDENKNCQKTIKVIKSDSKIGILTNEKRVVVSDDDIIAELKENHKKYEEILSDSKIGILTNEKRVVVSYGDIIAELKENYKKYETFSVFTQGHNAIVDISDKVKEINDKNQCNIILLSRGGGNESDINTVFNNRDIIKTIQKLKIPIITAIGHANDITFSDLVAFDNTTTPTSGIQKVFKLIKSAVEFKNNNDEQLDLFFENKKDFSEKVKIEFSKQTNITNLYDENKNIIILNCYLLIKILNQYNFKIYFLYSDDILSNLNLITKILYLNATQLKETIDFVFFTSNNRVTNYNNDRKLLSINRNIILNLEEILQK
ncbi:MAG: exodeoxyribonuclease VII large subunit [Candidatus Phytoplasma pyri]